MANKLVLIDHGHGGYSEGMTLTPDRGIYTKTISLSEGQLNRAAAHSIAFELSLKKIPVHIIGSGNADVSLRDRVKEVNRLAKKYKCALFSIHHNGFSDENVKGFELFTSLGETPSDTIAERFGKAFMCLHPERKLRKLSEVGKVSKEAPFYILKKTICPAVLIEWGFMTNKDERAYIVSQRGRNDLSRYMVLSIQQTYDLW